jgi:hypothetical protein
MGSTERNTDLRPNLKHHIKMCVVSSNVMCTHLFFLDLDDLLKMRSTHHETELEG